MDDSFLSVIAMQSIWSHLAEDLTMQCLLYLDPIVLGKLSWYGKVYHRAFIKRTDEAWLELSEWEDLVEIAFPPNVKTFLAAWNESFPIYQNCLTTNRYDYPRCQYLRNIRLPCRNEPMSDLTHSGFICISMEDINGVHKDYDVSFASFIDVYGKFGPPGCIVELEMIDFGFPLTDVGQALQDRHERTSFYMGLGYTSHGFGVSAPDFFTWIQMFSTNQFFHDCPVSKDYKIPLIWGRCGWKSWATDRLAREEKQNTQTEIVEDERNDQENAEKEAIAKYQNRLPELLACFER